MLSPAVPPIVQLGLPVPLKVTVPLTNATLFAATAPAFESLLSVAFALLLENVHFWSPTAPVVAVPSAQYPLPASEPIPVTTPFDTVATALLAKPATVPLFPPAIVTSVSALTVSAPVPLFESIVAFVLLETVKFKSFVPVANVAAPDEPKEILFATAAVAAVSLPIVALPEFKFQTWLEPTFMVLAPLTAQ